VRRDTFGDTHPLIEGPPQHQIPNSRSWRIRPTLAGSWCRALCRNPAIPGRIVCCRVMLLGYKSRQGQVHNFNHLAGPTSNRLAGNWTEILASLLHFWLPPQCQNRRWMSLAGPFLCPSVVIDPAFRVGRAYCLRFPSRARLQEGIAQISEMEYHSQLRKGHPKLA
jgi:hypothetical protein